MDRKPKKRITEYSIPERRKNLKRSWRYFKAQKRAWRKMKGWRAVRMSFWLIRREALLKARELQIEQDRKKMLQAEIRKLDELPDALYGIPYRT